MHKQRQGQLLLPRAAGRRKCSRALVGSVQDLVSVQPTPVSVTDMELTVNLNQRCSPKCLPNAGFLMVAPVTICPVYVSFFDFISFSSCKNHLF